MTPTTIANVLYAVVAIGAYVLEHFSLIPAGTANVITGSIVGFAAGTGTLVPKQKTATTPTTNTISNNLPTNTPVRG